MGNVQARLRAIDMLRAMRDRDIYEGGDYRGCGSGKFYVTYSDGHGPELDREDVSLLLQQGYIEELYVGCYCLRGLRDSRMANWKRKPK